MWTPNRAMTHWHNNPAEASNVHARDDFTVNFSVIFLSKEFKFLYLFLAAFKVQGDWYLCPHLVRSCPRLPVDSWQVYIPKCYQTEG